MDSIADIRRAVMKQIPPEARFTKEDAEVIFKHKTFLLSLEDHLVNGFYDMLYNHPETRAVFREGERRDREMTLREWWRRVVKGPFNHEFWDWMTFVGLVHVVRRVKNPMMLSAWGFVHNAVVAQAKQNLPLEEALTLSEALGRMGQTFSCFVADGYLIGIMEAVGGNPNLLEHLASQEMGLSLEDFRRTIGRGGH